MSQIPLENRQWSAATDNSRTKRVVVLDFDGTYITCDSLPRVLRLIAGFWRYCWGMLVCLPWLVGYKLRLVAADKAKERLIGHFVAGMPYDEFKRRCQAFNMDNYGEYLNHEPVQALIDALDAGDQVVVVTASVTDWVKPWFDGLGVPVVGTQLEVDDQQRLTGRFATPNCNGAEKWRRLVEFMPEVEHSRIVAYGDSRGDKEMLDHAHEAYYRNFTTPRDMLPTLERHPGRLFWPVLALLVLYQLLGVFFGMDVADAGFYLTFYDNIFTHPQSVEYNFMYYLSGVLGGTLQRWLPSMGIAGMRLMGVALNTLCAIIIWKGLRGRINEPSITLGCALVVVTFIAPPYTLSYDLCTIVLYVGAITALWNGIVKRQPFLIMLAGLMAGLNVLVRIPNVLGLSMVAMPLLFQAFKTHRDWLLAISESMLFLMSGLIAVCFTIISMPHSHYSAFSDVFDDLQAMAVDTSGTASHTTGQMMMTQLRFYGTGLWTLLKLAVPVVAYWWAHERRGSRWLSLAVKTAAVALMVWFTWRMHPLEPMWAMCLIGCVGIMIHCRREERTWLAVMGLGMMLVMPMGSDGAYNNGTIVCWMAAPVAGLWWTMRCRRALPVVLLAVCAVRMVTGGAYFDSGSLLDKRYTVNNERAAHIYTTRERAEVLNTLLQGIKPYVKPDSTLMAYGSIPLMNYLTHTHPYIGCSWVEQLSADMLKSRLAKAQWSELPLVLRQKFNTLGGQWGEPSETYLTDYGTQNTYQDNRKLAVLNAWLQEHNYQPVYEDSHFVLLKHVPLPPPPLDTTRAAREERRRLLMLSVPSRPKPRR